jgi:purine-binding chemotaxis protein CheW
MNTANLPLQKKETTSQKIKLLVFPIKNIYVGLHIDTVQKVVNYSTVYSSGLNDYGVVNLDEQEITVVDLHKRLFNTPQSSSETGKKYLLLAQNTVAETFGILIAETPGLYDVSLDKIRALPASYRQADTLKIASHVTVIPQENQPNLTIFILDPDELVPPVSVLNR